MSLEATMILMDNSDYARNGDLYPSRWESQIEAIQLIANSKFNNSESGVGLILSAGKQVQLLMTPTNDQNQLIASVENQRLGGTIHFSIALHISELALKHRVNKKQAQRIMAFVASPVEEDEASLIQLAKRLRKNNIAVDILNFGEQREDHIAKLEKFVETVKKGSNSMFINVRPGDSAIDQLFNALSSNSQNQQFDSVPAQQNQNNNNAGQPAANPFAEWGGIDPSVDPELAMAMKLSLEESAREAQEAAQNPPANEQVPQQPQQQQAPQSAMIEEQLAPTNQPQTQITEEEDDEEQELLKRARELSLGEEAIKQEDGGLDPDFMEQLLKNAEEALNEEDSELLKNKDRSDKP